MAYPRHRPCTNDVPNGPGGEFDVGTGKLPDAMYSNHVPVLSQPRGRVCAGLISFMCLVVLPPFFRICRVGLAARLAGAGGMQGIAIFFAGQGRARFWRGAYLCT
nr:hypothetical protein RVX_1449 [Nitratidesulfovibrio sp. HK-II]